MEVLYSIIGLAIIVVPLWRICGRAGFNPAIALLAIIPFLGFIVVVAILAFIRWPVYKSVDQSGLEDAQ